MLKFLIVAGFVIVVLGGILSAIFAFSPIAFFIALLVIGWYGFMYITVNYGLWAILAVVGLLIGGIFLLYLIGTIANLFSSKKEEDKVVEKPVEKKEVKTNPDIKYVPLEVKSLLEKFSPQSKEYNAVIEYYRTLNESGIHKSKLEQAKDFIEGNGTLKNETVGLGLIELKELNRPESQLYYANAEYNRVDQKPDYSSAVRFFTLAYDPKNRDFDLLNRIINCYLKLNNPAHALLYSFEASTFDDYQLPDMLEEEIERQIQNHTGPLVLVNGEGEGFRAGIPQAFLEGNPELCEPKELYQMYSYAATRFLNFGTLGMANCLQNGIYIEKDEDRANRNFVMAAENYCKYAYIPAAYAYITGVGVQQDFRMVSYYLERLADSSLEIDDLKTVINLYYNLVIKYNQIQFKDLTLKWIDKGKESGLNFKDEFINRIKEAH